MADYSRATERFFYTGLSCFPPDALPAGKYPYVRNLRVYADGELRPRAGLDIQQTVGDAVHTLARLNDPTTFNMGVPAVRVLGAASNLYRGVPGNAAPGVLDSGYSGNPLTPLTAQPPNSPRPWLYVADSSRYRKFTTDGVVRRVGIAQPSDPTTEPLVALDTLKQSAHDIQTSTAWTPAGVQASVVGVGSRVNTTISQILYDNGVTGYASIVPASSVHITVGTLLTIGTPPGSFDNPIVTEVTIAIAPTTVEAISYDVGNTGLCTIQPAGSLGTGQLEAPPIDAYRRRAHRQQGRPYAVPRGEAGISPLTPDSMRPTFRFRQVDFPVNCIIDLGGEVVRILSVALGTDGRQCFRCRTASTVTVGASITGLPAFRVFLPNTWVPGNTITRDYLENTLTFPTPPLDEKSLMTAGIQSVFAINLAQFSDGTAVLPEDELHLAVNVNRLQDVVSVRVYIDVDPTTNDFLQNYFFHEWRASDIITAVQAVNAQNIQPLVDARRTVVANQQLEGPAAEGTSYEAILRRALRLSLEQGGVGLGKAPRELKVRGGRMLAQATSASAISTQLALGNNQWIDLRVKIGSMVRVGTDPTRTLADAKAFEILLAAEAQIENIIPDPLVVKYSDLQIYGGGGPDVGEVGDPYVYTYRYRSSESGAVSNPAPASRGGQIPRRQNLFLTATPSADPQVDKIDWYRLGGTLTSYTYVGTGPNDANPFTDDRMDQWIDGGEPLAYENFQPWPLQDLPRTGTCNVAGTAIDWVSGDVFDVRWAPGSVILVNGRATTLYASPSSPDKMHVVDNLSSGTAVEFSLPGPTLLSQPLGRCWGDYRGFWFACGDPINPGTLYWSNGKNIEAANDANALIVTSGSDPLQNGGIYNTFPFVATTEDLYQILVQPENPFAPIRTIKTPCGRGFWTPWAWCMGPEGIFFLAPDGIALTQGGSPAELLTSPDLRDIFPKDGIHGVAVNGIPAPDMTQTTKLRLSYVSGWVYFDYVDGAGASWSLVYDTSAKRFFLDSSDRTGLRVRLEEPGAGIYNHIVGGENGEVFQYDADALTDAGDPIPWQLDTRWPDGGNPRVQKQFGDIGVNLSGGGSPITFQPIVDNGTVTPAPTVATPGVGARETVIVGLPAGQLGQNIGLRITGSVLDSDADRPRLLWWEPSYLLKADNASRRVTDWEDLGYVGAKFVQGVIIRANTYGLDKQLRIQRDTATGPETMITLTINHDGEAQIAYPLAAEGWNPFVAELVRIEGADDVEWQFLSARFVWEPAPELATQWETQYTSEDYPGYLHERDMVIAHETTAPLTLRLTYDDRTQTYVIPPSGGVYKRIYLVLCPGKGKSVRYKFTTPEPGRLYQKDMSVRAQGWGDPTGYRTLMPFGGPHRASGAQI